jgi:uncharacterized RDD family membrane protein YckC
MNTSNAYAPPKAAVADVEPGSAGLTLAGRGARFLGYILDVVIVCAIVYTPMFLTGDLNEAMAETMRTGNSLAFYSSFASGGGAIGVLGFLVWAVITFILVKRNGQTIAKKIIGIKVVRSDGSYASVARIFWLRNVVNGLLGIIPLYFIIDSLFIFGERRQCVHDKIADTIVVNA